MPVYRISSSSRVTWQYPWAEDDPSRPAACLSRYGIYRRQGMIHKPSMSARTSGHRQAASYLERSSEADRAAAVGAAVGVWVSGESIRISLALLRMASAIGPSSAGPENIRSSSIVFTSATSMVTRNLKILGMPLTAGLRLGFVNPVHLTEAPERPPLSAGRFAARTPPPRAQSLRLAPSADPWSVHTRPPRRAVCSRCRCSALASAGQIFGASVWRDPVPSREASGTHFRIQIARPSN